MVNLVFTYASKNEIDIEDSHTIIIGFNKDQNCKCREYEECNECKCKCGYFDSSDSEDEFEKPDDCICLEKMFYECFLEPFENEQFINKITNLLGNNIKYDYYNRYYYNPDRQDDMKVYDVTIDDKANFRLNTIKFLTQINKYKTNITKWVEVVGKW